MSKLPESPLSPAQLEIMEIVWDNGEVAAIEVRDILRKRRPVARETVRTVLQRMEEKGWLTHRVVGRTYFYSARFPRRASLGHRVLEFVDTMCAGYPERLVTALLEYRGLTDHEAKRIEAMIAAARKKRKQSPRE
jgi:predicted transcriptional regulator